MQKNIKELTIQMLENLKEYYQKKSRKIMNQISIENDNIRRQLDEKRTPKIILGQEEIKERVTKYLYSTDISDISFLNYNMRIEKSFNNKGRIHDTQLPFFDEEMKNLIQSYGINNERELFFTMIDYQCKKKDHPIMQDENFIIAWNKANTLGHLDKIFQNEQNRLDYQGTYAAFQYVKKHIWESLSINTEEKEEELVWKNFDQKKILVTENLAPIETNGRKDNQKMATIMNIMRG